jgi:hypothetical protein
MPLASSTLSHPLLCCVSAAPILRQCIRVCIAGRGDPGVGGSRHCRAACLTVVLATETSAQEVAMTQDSTTLHIKDAEDWATLAERKAWERVLRVDAENAVALVSTHEDAEGLVPKVG